MTVAIAGTRVLVRHLASDTEQLKEFDDEDEAAQGFAATLQDLVKRKWDLDPEHAPNPEPLPAETVLELIPPKDKNWMRLTKVRDTDLLLQDAVRINGRKADAMDPEDLEDVTARIREDGSKTLHVVEGGGEVLFTVAQAAVDTLTRLVVDTPYLSLTRQTPLELGDISYVISQLPKLELAHIVGACDGVSFESETLQELHIMGSPLHSSVIKALLDGNLPALHTLSIGLSHNAESDFQTEGLLEELVESDALPSLKKLTVQAYTVPEAFLEAAASSKLIERLEVLAIPDEFHDDERTTKILNQNTDKLRHLTLEIDMIDELFPDLKIREPQSPFVRTFYMERLGMVPRPEDAS
jgi:hypothetical protein